MSFLTSGLSGGNEKALFEQGHSTLTKIPNIVTKEVNGEYQAFKGLAINCFQFVNREPRNASLRITPCERYGKSIRLAINGRGGRTSCHLMSTKEVDDLIARLTQLRFGLAVAESRGKS